MIIKILRRSAPLLIILVAIAGAQLLMATKEAPEQKPEAIALPIVDVQTIEQQTVSLDLPSYGVVEPKYKTQLVTEVKGRLLTLSDKFVAGGVVVRGDMLAQLEPSDYQADLIQAQATLAQAKAALEEERARGEVAKNDWKGYDNGVPPELGLRKPQLKKELANVKYAQAALERAERNLERTMIRAPFDGIIKSRNVDLGQYVSQGTNLGELYDTRIAEVRLPIANEELAYLESANNPNTQVTLSAKLAGAQVQWQGEIVRSEGVIDANNRMIYLVAEVKDPYLRESSDNSQLPLKYGSFVNAVIKGRNVSGITKLPRHLVTQDKVAIVQQDNTLELRKVNIVRSDLEYVYIKDSLQNGERISITNLNNMVSGQEVKVLGEKSNPQPDSGKTLEAKEQAIAAAGDR